MSRDDKEKSRGYLVGYGKPPAEHRFKKGVSGNPRGRPKGGRNKAAPFRSWDRPTQEMLLDEAYRPILLREGEAVIELPAIQAVFRAMGVAAVKGNRFAQKTLAELVQRVEQQHHQTQYENLESFTEYKMKWNEEIERCKRLGLPAPEPLPHPDDVLIDYRKGTFRIAGPITKEEKAGWDKLITRRDDAQAEVLECARLEKEQPEYAKFYREDRLCEQKIFDIINEKLPERYQAKLEGRLRVAENEDDESDESDVEAA
jgi:hypothetical protein